MLRIERVQNEAGETTVRATGRLSGPWIAELERSLSSLSADLSAEARGAKADAQSAKAAQDVVILDLTDVSFVDREGIEYLRLLRRLALVDLRCSAFVAEQINSHTRQ
jgi:hypothetical protein